MCCLAELILPAGAADGVPKAALNVTTEYLANGTIATTTTTTNPDGSTTTTVRLVDPSNIQPASAPVAAEPEAVGPSASVAALSSVDEILTGSPLPPPATPDSPVYAYASAVDLITGGVFRSRRRRSLLAAADAVPGFVRLESHGDPSASHPGAWTCITPPRAKLCHPVGRKPHACNPCTLSQRFGTGSAMLQRLIQSATSIMHHVVGSHAAALRP